MAFFILLKNLEVGARFIKSAKNVNVIASPDLSGRGNLRLCQRTVPWHE